MATKKTWTVILSSGAQTPIKQFRLSKLAFYVSLSIFPILVVSIASLYYVLSEVTNEKAALVVELEEKVKEVEEIQHDYFVLQQETITVKKTIEEFRFFEEQLSNLNLDIPSDLTNDNDGSGGKLYPQQFVQPSRESSLKLQEMKEEVPILIQRFEETLLRLTAYENELKTIPTIFPAADGRISSRFGNRPDPFNWRRTAFHSGIDIAAPLNTPILAGADGEVIFAGRNGGYGKTIIIDHGGTYETLYAHLNRIQVEVGDKVVKGQAIGGMGTTGRSTGVHLHYEIKRNGERIDPFTYITFHERQN